MLSTMASNASAYMFGTTASAPATPAGTEPAPTVAVQTHAMTRVEQDFNDLINNNRVVVFGTSNCKGCKAAKQALSIDQIQFAAVDLDVIPDAEEMSKALADKINGLESVP